MSGGPPIDIATGDWLIVCNILSRIVPEHEVWVFGSRARRSAKTYSDLDLAIIGAGPVSLALMGELSEAFEESALPFKVDLVDWASTSDSFRAIIEAGRVLIQSGRGGSARAAPARVG
jgi:predicted nucleotidyltransferase